MEIAVLQEHAIVTLHTVETLLVGHAPQITTIILTAHVCSSSSILDFILFLDFYFYYLFSFLSSMFFLTLSRSSPPPLFSPTLFNIFTAFLALSSLLLSLN
jgi:hypothetical protein